MSDEDDHFIFLIGGATRLSAQAGAEDQCRVSLTTAGPAANAHCVGHELSLALP